MLTRRIFVVTAILAVLLTPVMAHAALVEFPLVQCGGLDSGGAVQPPCTPCGLFDALSRVINLILFGITAPIAAFMVVLSGGQMLLGGANASNYSEGKKRLTNTLMGVTVILLAWVITNFLIRSLGGGQSDAGPWYEFNCPAYLSAIEVEDTEVTLGPPPGLPLPPPPPPRAPKSDEIEVGGLKGSALYTKLAAANGVPYPAKNSSQLNSLIDCLYQDPVVSALTFPKPADGGAKQVGNFTYDNDHMVCNFTRGKAINGGACSHGQNGRSCHYGGAKGTNGAEAVDFNATFTRVTIPGLLDSNGQPKRVYSDEVTLFCEIYRVLVKEKKCAGQWKLLLRHSDHTHISTKVCDLDGDGGVSSLPPGACASSLVTPTAPPPANP